MTDRNRERPGVSVSNYLQRFLQPSSVQVVELWIAPAPIRCWRQPATARQQEADGGKRRQREQSNTERPDSDLLVMGNQGSVPHDELYSIAQVG